MQGNNIEVDRRFLRKFRKSPLNVNLAYDVSFSKNILGELLPNGMRSGQAWNLRLMSYTGLICGDAYTGRVRWMDKKCEEGLPSGVTFDLSIIRLGVDGNRHCRSRFSFAN